MKYYEIDMRGNCPWGDYGRILAGGLVNGTMFSSPLTVSRSGPHVPTIGLAGYFHLVANSHGVGFLRGEDFVGLEFVPVTIEKLVRINWHTWDTSKDIPDESMPTSGEPEDFILEGKHDPSLHDEVGKLWQVKCLLYTALEKIPEQSKTIACVTTPGKFYATSSARDSLMQLKQNTLSFKAL